ncbi:MAG: M18 family aminopeptidase [Acidimicrobiales bacterium]
MTTPDSFRPAPGNALERLMSGIDASPTPYHAVAEIGQRLVAAGFVESPLDGELASSPGGHFVRRGGALIAWRLPDGPIDGFTLVGAHSDSPNLRIKQHATSSSAGWAQLGVEVYGGVLLNSWLDRDLGIAGRLRIRGANGVETRLVEDRRPILRVPQLAIHLDREIRESGLLLNPQTHVNPLWALGTDEPGAFADHLAGLAGVAADEILAAEVMAFDTQPGAIVGRDGDLFATARIDNQFSCFAATEALISLSDTNARVPVFVMFDHEEIGSTTATGAGSRMVASLLERIAAGAGADRPTFLRLLQQSIVISADGAHATHPNYADKHDPNHRIEVNAGVVVKRNANQRYATDADSEWFIRSVCAEAGLPLQTYHHRNDLPCGSTIGPTTAAALGVPTIDIGAPQLAMHSIREMAGTADVGHLVATLTAAWSSTIPLDD